VSRPPLEVADLVRAAGDAFIERSRKWISWKHVKVLLAIARCRTAALGGHLVQLLPQSALPEVSSRGARPLARSASPGASPDTLRPCGLHAASRVGTTGLAEQEGHLRSPVSRQCGNPSRSRS